MKITFRIDYRTQWGQSMYVCGSIPELGKWDEENAILMTLTSGELWEVEIDCKNPSDFDYKFLIKDSYSFFSAWESGENRKAQLSNTHFDHVYFRDFWRSANELQNSLFTSPFKTSFFKRNAETYHFEYSKKASYLKLQLRAPRIGEHYSFGVIGSSEELGKWDPGKVVLLNDQHFPIWQVDLAVKSTDFPMEYKYVIYSHIEDRIVTWENRSNRYLPGQMDDKKSRLTVWTDENFLYPVGNWKAAGVAIPVFSLRSETGTGVGEFTDIKGMVDWSVLTGMKLIQILPVNDTIATHSWVDSYPYAAISVHALHPIYANLQSIGKLKNKKLQDKIDSERLHLNMLEEIDYEAVMKLKTEFFAAAYQEQKTVFLKRKDFKTFFQANESWLLPYAIFSSLRDKFGTPDFTQWGEYAQMTISQMQSYASEKSVHFDDIAVHYFIQYHLDKQLKEASHYARDKGVVLKGDIPIGIYRNSVDAWMQPQLYNMDCQAGAPPDDFSISGQNWGFPTYNWEEMEKDGFAWWQDRLVKMSEYFDVFRIDHILGFFRIWEIPYDCVEGLMGRFNPSLPLSVEELEQKGIFLDHERLCKPYIRYHMIRQLFHNHADSVFSEYLQEYSSGKYEFKSQFNSQRKIKEHIDAIIENDPATAGHYNWIRFNLYRLHGEVIFMEAPLSDGKAFNPRIAFHATYSFQELDHYTRTKLDELYNHYFYHRHNEFWRESAMRKLPAIKAATEMLICGEDLGMVPASVPGVMNELSILSLAIQRMPNDDRVFWHPSDTPYLSVTSTGSHDMSTLREWWQEDTDKTQRFYQTILGQGGKAPYFCEPWIARDIIIQHLHSPSMWAIFPIQDIIAMDASLRKENPESERINVPANPQHYWRYRFHLTNEQLLKQENFNGFLRQMVDQGGRSSDY